MSMTPVPSELYDILRQHSSNPAFFAGASGISITRLETGRAEGVLSIRPDSLNHMGNVHGGCLLTLADTVCGLAALTNGMVYVTLNCSFQFLRPAGGSRITCVAEPERVGQSVCVYRCVLRDDAGQEVGVGTFSFFAVAPADPAQILARDRMDAQESSASAGRAD